MTTAKTKTKKPSAKTLERIRDIGLRVAKLPRVPAMGIIWFWILKRDKQSDPRQELKENSQQPWEAMARLAALHDWSVGPMGSKELFGFFLLSRIWDQARSIHDWLADVCRDLKKNTPNLTYSELKRLEQSLMILEVVTERVQTAIDMNNTYSLSLWEEQILIAVKKYVIEPQEAYFRPKDNGQKKKEQDADNERLIISFPIANHELAKLCDLDPDTVSSQMRKALGKAGKAIKKGGQGIDREWSIDECCIAYHHLPKGKLKIYLRTARYKSGLQT